MAPKEKIVNKLTNKLVLSEKLSSINYHSTFRVLAITASREIHFVEVIPNVLKKIKSVELRLEKAVEPTVSYDKNLSLINNNNDSNINESVTNIDAEKICSNNNLAYSSVTKEKQEEQEKKKKSKSMHYQHQQRQQTQININKKVEYDTQPFVLQIVKTIKKVKMPTSIVWYPNPSEMSVAFIQQGNSVMIILNVLVISEETKSIVQQRQVVNIEKEHVISVDVDDHSMHHANTNYNTNSSSSTVNMRNNTYNGKNVRSHVSERYSSTNSYLSPSTRSTQKDVKLGSEQRNVYSSSTPTTFTGNTFTSVTDISCHVDNEDKSNCTSNNNCNNKKASPKSRTNCTYAGEVNSVEESIVPIELVKSNTVMSSAAQLLKENIKKEVIINVNTKERTIEKIAWDLHNPYTLAVSSSTTWFELWYFDQNEEGEISLSHTLHPPQGHDQIKVSDLVFSPHNPNLIIVMAEVRNQCSAVIFDRHQLDRPKFIATPSRANTASFHPLFTDLLAISYYKTSDPKQGQIAFLSITEKMKTAATESIQKINTLSECNRKQRTATIDNVSQEQLEEKEEELTEKWKKVISQIDNNNLLLLAESRGESNNNNNKNNQEEEEEEEEDDEEEDEVMNCNDGCNFIIREDVLPPIDTWEMITHLRWRPPSYGQYVQRDANYKYRTFTSHLPELDNSNNSNIQRKQEYYSELLSTQLWLGTLAFSTSANTDSSTAADVHINVWDALNAQLPVASIKYLETKAKVPVDFVWINEISLVAILKNGSVISTSLLNSRVNRKAKELMAPNREFMLLPNVMEKKERNMSHDLYSTSYSSYSLSLSSPTQSTKVHPDHSNSVTISPNTSTNMLSEADTSKELQYDVDETVDLSSMHTILPTSAIDCGFFGNVYVIRNSAASLKTHYLSIVNEECNTFISRLVKAMHAEEQFPMKVTQEHDKETLQEESTTLHVEPVMERNNNAKTADDNAKEIIEKNVNEITRVQPLASAASSKLTKEATTTTTTLARTTAVSSINNSTTANTNTRTEESLWWTRMKEFVRSAIGNTSHKPHRQIRKTTQKDVKCSRSHKSTNNIATIRSVTDNTDRNQRFSANSLEPQAHLSIPTTTVEEKIQHVTTTLPPTKQFSGDCKNSVYVNTCEENNNTPEHLVQTTLAENTENSCCSEKNEHHDGLDDNNIRSGNVVNGWPLIKITRDICMNNSNMFDKTNTNNDNGNGNGKKIDDKEANTQVLCHNASGSVDSNNNYNVIECTEMQLHLPFVHPCLEVFCVDHNNCGWAYCESAHASELFAMYALKWEMGYEVAEGLRHLDSIIDKISNLREEQNNELRCSIANQQSHSNSLSRRAPNITFTPDVYIVDDRFAAMMESNAEICDECNERLYKTHHHNSSSQQTPWWSSFDLTTLERQESSANEQTPDSGTAEHVHNTSLLSSNNYNNDLLKSKYYNECNYTDTRAHWWRVMAESLRSHNAEHVYEVTISQLEYASLIGDVQYCLVLYILYCLWWRIRHMESVDLNITRYKEQNDYINATSERKNNVNASHTFNKLKSSLECPLMPNQTGNCSEFTKLKSDEVDGKKHDEEEQHEQYANQTRCTPDQWKMRALQWLETYSNALRQRKLFVPLNELLLIFPEISHEEKNAVQPKAPEIAYGKRATYIFCGNCNEEIEPEMSVTKSLEVPEVIKSFQSNINCEYYHQHNKDRLHTTHDQSNEETEYFTSRNEELTQEHHYARDEGKENYHRVNSIKPISVSQRANKCNRRHSYSGPCNNNTKCPLKETIASLSTSTTSTSSSSSSLSKSQIHRSWEHLCEYGNAHTSLAETKNEHWIHNASCHHCNDATAMKCVICNEVVEGLYYWLCSCGHGGHPYHIQEWLEVSNQCPRCGVVITDNINTYSKQKTQRSTSSSSLSSSSSSNSSAY